MFRKNKVPWIAGGVLILIFVIGGFVVSSKKKKPPTPAQLPETARAVEVPADRNRTLVVPPCETPLQQSVSSAAAGKAIPGATTLQLPKGNGQRTVLVAHCQPGTGATTIDGTIPSAALVLGDTGRRPESEGGIQEAGFLARSQLVLGGNGSSATILVVPGCTKKGGAKGRDAVLSAGGGSSRVAVAPAC